MHVTLQVKLQPTPEQAARLLRTMRPFNAACDDIAAIAIELRSANWAKLHHATYAHDQRIMSWKVIDRVSPLTLDGREVMPVVMGGYHEDRIGRLRGQADLAYRDGMFFLHCVADLDEPPPYDAEGNLGVDLGIKNIATTSDGENFGGGQLRGLRERAYRLRRRLRALGLKSAKRLLKRRRRKESRHAANVNHVIAKSLVRTAKDPKRALVLEGIKGIRSRITVHKPQRRKQHAWAFAQLRAFVDYKARLEGVPVLAVDPRHTSQACNVCGLQHRKLGRRHAAERGAGLAGIRKLGPSGPGS